ncbi:hypothetical protein ACIRF8_31355 [Streptomyces sp. NPDC102406]|uniref:hypothetical protein n=1 Tax=Streptomyces sp. NPDC102406 TaxID=3366171 RepID=UPI0037FD9502
MARNKIRPLGHCVRCTRACWKESSDASRWNTEFDKGVPIGLLCPTCQTPEENAEAEVKAATLDYTNTVTDADGRQGTAPVGGWHTVTAGGHAMVDDDKSVHLVLAIEAAELRIAVGPHSDARLAELFASSYAAVIRAALAQHQARPGGRTVVYNPVEGLEPDTVWAIEDHALCEDGEDRGNSCCPSPPGSTRIC